MLQPWCMWLTCTITCKKIKLPLNFHTLVIVPCKHCIVMTNTCLYIQVPPLPASHIRSEHIPPQPPPKKKTFVPPPREVHLDPASQPPIRHPDTQPPREAVAVNIPPPSPATSANGRGCGIGEYQEDDLLSTVSSAPTVEHFNISVSCHM